MKIPWRVLWWSTRDEVAGRWKALVAGLVLAFACVLGWVRAAGDNEHPDVGRIARWTATYMIAIVVVAVMAGAAAVIAGQVKGNLASTSAHNAVTYVAVTLVALSAAGIAIGIVMYGGEFLHIDIFLKLLHRDD